MKLARIQIKRIPAKTQSLGLLAQQKPVVLGAGYFSIINLISFGLFGYDKNQAVNHSWRIPEKNLQLSALLGGWPAGILAMNFFKHKTKKEPFRTIYFSACAANVLIIGGIGSFLMRRNFIGLSTRIKRQLKYYK